MKKKLFFIGMVIIALVLTTGTFAYTYTSSSSTLQATLADTAWATYQASDNQPDWNSVMPQGGTTTVNLVPVAAGDVTDILAQSPNSGEHWDKVDDQPADGNTSYVSTYGSSVWQGDFYQIADLPAGSANVSSVIVYAVYASADSWTAKIMTELLTNGQQFSGNTESTSSTNWVTISTTYDTNPATGEQWTVAEVNGVQAGITLKGPKNNQAAYCTQVYVQVSYTTPGVIQGEVPQGDLYKITPAADYTGDLMVKIYLMNTSNLIKAYRYLNMSVYTTNSLEAGETPTYKVLSLENGVVEFNIMGGMAAYYKVSVTGGSYSLISDNPANWSPGYTVTPEFYCEVTQR
jgi:hypothetical protein